MSVRKFCGLLVLLTVTSMVLGASPPAHAGVAGWISYAVKFVCNAESLDDRVLQGKYRTMINIHNPHNITETPLLGGVPVPVKFFKKAVLAIPQGEPPLPPSCHQEELLESDWALGVDCDNIKTLLGLSGLPTTGDLEGFLVIEVPPFQGMEQTAPPPLDVVAVYTARPRTGTDPDTKIYDVRTMDVERVEPQNIIGIPQINLCSADWPNGASR